jgi:hypothetical protein
MKRIELASIFILEVFCGDVLPLPPPVMTTTRSWTEYRLEARRLDILQVMYLQENTRDGLRMRSPGEDVHFLSVHVLGFPANAFPHRIPRSAHRRSDPIGTQVSNANK